MKTSRKFATSPYILVAKEKNSVANAIVLVAIVSLDNTQCLPSFSLGTYIITMVPRENKNNAYMYAKF